MRREMLFCVVTLCACARGGGSADTSATPAPAVAQPAGSVQTSIEGRVVLVGPDPGAWVALAGLDGAQTRLTGADTELLRNVSGAQVQVYGEREGTVMRVTRFEVRSVDDRAVHDGVVVVRDAAVYVRGRDGERVVPDAPPSLRAIPGARVWVTRTEPGTAPSFGVISRP